MVLDIYSWSLKLETVPGLPEWFHCTPQGAQPLPGALTSHLRKALERLVLDRLQFTLRPRTGGDDAIIYLLHQSLSHLETVWISEDRVLGFLHQPAERETGGSD